MAIRSRDPEQLDRVVHEVRAAGSLGALLRQWTTTIVRFAPHDEAGGIQVPAPAQDDPSRELTMQAVGQLFQATVAGDTDAAHRICEAVAAWPAEAQSAISSTVARIVDSTISPLAVPSHYLVLLDWLAVIPRGEEDQAVLEDLLVVISRMWHGDGSEGARAAGVLLTGPDRLRRAITLLARVLGSRLPPGSQVTARVIETKEGSAGTMTAELDTATTNPELVEDSRRRALLLAGRAIRDMANGEPDRVRSDLDRVAEDTETLGTIALVLCYMFRSRILGMEPVVEN
ncbi:MULTISPECIES: hypothetical protein [Actinoalloteichus]|uniref:hypothetical protein n=1 Tax=Actinoalloteichus TaxID=65496 RepID=UPI0012DC4703|nr:hypothetical protein [Actinoalloteichus caeruleus]